MKPQTHLQRALDLLERRRALIARVMLWTDAHADWLAYARRYVRSGHGDSPMRNRVGWRGRLVRDLDGGRRALSRRRACASMP